MAQSVAIYLHNVGLLGHMQLVEIELTEKQAKHTRGEKERYLIKTRQKQGAN